MTKLAHKILLVVLDSAADHAAPAFDAVAAQGCNGSLVVPESTTSDAELLLGIERKDNAYSLAYPKLPLSLFSSSPATCTAARSAGVSTVRELSSDANARDEISSLLTSNEAQFVAVHVDYIVSEGHWLDSLVAELLPKREADGSGAVFIAIVKPCATAEPAAELHPFRPRQSTGKFRGEYPEGNTGFRRLLLAFVHHDHTRRDEVQRFDAAHLDVLGGGGYGAMSARALVQELAFRLGHAPKYGA